MEHFLFKFKDNEFIINTDNLHRHKISNYIIDMFLLKY